MTRLLVCAPLVLLLTGCGEQKPTTWQDVAWFGVFLFGLAAIEFASTRRR